MTNVQAVIFDLGRVLVDIDNQFLVETLFKGLETDNLQELGRKTMSDPAMVEFNTGRMGAEEFHRRMCDTYKIEPDFEIFKKQWCEIFTTMDGMQNLIKHISKDVTMGLLSDTDPIHWNHIKKTWPWIGEIRNPTLSYEIGVMKPNAEIYLTAARNVNTPPEQCLFIDDLQANIEGAQDVGMQGIRFETVEALARELQKMHLLQTWD
jgi:putative hydrolase of the HAD superfamily